MNDNEMSKISSGIDRLGTWIDPVPDFIKGVDYLKLLGSMPLLRLRILTLILILLSNHQSLKDSHWKKQHVIKCKIFIPNLDLRTFYGISYPADAACYELAIHISLHLVKVRLTHVCNGLK